jgi:predicted nucleic acid-binding protein
MLLDANLLLYAVHRGADRHDAARDWLTEQLNGSRRVGIPLSPATAWERATDWLASPVAWIPEPGPEHARILGDLITRHDIRGGLVPDAMLAALAIEHGLTLCSTDTDFARFSELRWENPLRDATL